MASCRTSSGRAIGTTRSGRRGRGDSDASLGPRPSRVQTHHYSSGRSSLPTENAGTGIERLALVGSHTGAVTTSDWAAIDAAADPQRLIDGLDQLRREPFFAKSKTRMNALIRSKAEIRLVDVGCGTGEDAALLAERTPVIAIERSSVMAAEARRRHPRLPLVVTDGRCLPIPDDSVDVVRADRVLQHVTDGEDVLAEWKRVLRPGGCLLSFDPDLTTATIEGVDHDLAARVLAWRRATRPGAETVHALDAALVAAGFRDSEVERRVLDLAHLDRADGIMGLASWGDQAAKTNTLSEADAQRWGHDVHAAHQDGSLRYRCSYALGIGRAIA
jgi:SAM-dependent methyltransferase